MGDSLHILQHALGLDRYGQGSAYRRHFVTGPGSVDFDACIALVDAGLMTRTTASPLSGGDDVFLVTDAGRQHVQDTSPKPPPQTREQKRYTRYLEADCGLSFGEWLRRGPVVIHG